MTEDFLYADNRIQGPETGVIEVNAIGGHAFFEQCVFHVERFIVTLSVIVAADDEVIDFAGEEKTGGGVHAVFEEGIGPAADDALGASENETNVAVRNQRYVRVGFAT